MKKINASIEIIFKLGWIVILLFSLFILCWLVFLTIATQNFAKGDGYNLTWINFIVPNFISVILLFLYSKELIIGYKQTSRRKTIISLYVVSTFAVIIVSTQFNFYKWVIQASVEEWFIILPIILIITSIAGLIIHRITNLKIAD